MELRGTKCVLRPWQPTDAESLARHANNRNVWRNLMDRFPHPYTIEDALEWVGMRADDAPPFMSLAISVDDEAVGSVGYDILPLNHDVTARAGYWLGEAFWGRGIATEACTLLRDYIFASHPDIHRIDATVYEWNLASMRVLEKSGFTKEGVMRKAARKDGEIIDVTLYAITRQELISGKQ